MYLFVVIGALAMVFDSRIINITSHETDEKIASILSVKTFEEDKVETKKSTSTRKPKNVNINIEKTTLGDISDLAALKTKLEGDKKAKE